MSKTEDALEDFNSLITDHIGGGDMYFLDSRWLSVNTVKTIRKALTNQSAEQDKRPKCKHCGEIIEQHNTDGGWCCLYDPIDNNEKILWSDRDKFEPRETSCLPIPQPPQEKEHG